MKEEKREAVDTGEFMTKLGGGVTFKLKKKRHDFFLIKQIW